MASCLGSADYRVESLELLTQNIAALLEAKGGACSEGEETRYSEEAPGSAHGSSNEGSAEESDAPLPTCSGARDDARASALATLPPILKQEFNSELGCHRVEWRIDAKKLRSRDRQAISPPFELTVAQGGPAIMFKLMLTSLSAAGGKGGNSFKSSKRGCVQLKCQGDQMGAAGNLRIFFSMHGLNVSLPRRGPMTHDFSFSAVASLSGTDTEWHLASLLAEGSAYLTVCADIEGVATP